MSDVRDKVTAKLVALKVPPAKAERKIKDAARWWKVGGAAIGVAALFCAAGLYMLLKREPSVLLAIALAVPVGLSVLVALFAASQADSEATKAFIATVLKLRRALAGKNGDHGRPPQSEDVES